MKNVKIISSDALSANGLNKQEIFKACLEGNTAVNAQGLASISDPTWSALSDLVQKDHNLFDKNPSRCLVASTYCLDKVLRQADWQSQDLQECGFIFATTTSQIDKWQNSLPLFYMKDLNPSQIEESVSYQSLGLTLVNLKNHFSILGPATVISSSCSASLQALALAALWIESGLVKRCIVGTTEILSELTIHGFNSMRLLSQGVCKPFDKKRNGINLGEASAFLCLENAELSSRRALGYIAGYGFSTDAYHPTAPHPEGLGCIQSIQMALNKSKKAVSDIDWIYAHGTGSQANDIAEAKALNQISKTFSHDLNQLPFVTSTKSIHGHTLGASGALESVLALESFKQNILLPTFFSDEIDPNIQIKINNRPLSKNLNYILKNSLGFGGINASIVFSKETGSN